MRLPTTIIVTVAVIAGVALSVWQRGQHDTTTPAWQFSQLNGDIVKQGDYAAETVMINFWASWCPPCIRELPLLDDLARTTPVDQLAVLAVALDNEHNVERFLAENPLGLEIALGFEDVKTAMTTWGNDTGALPFTVLLDGDGNLLKKHLGELLPESLNAFVNTP